jgi:hypothetical protein|tara:strand:+ start:482 stop:1057 length:576 start_codon:yes stop_codon:yes gene_type:complete
MGTIKTTNIQSISGSGTVTLGTSGETFTVPSGVTVNMSSATQTGVGGENTPAFFAKLSGATVISNDAYTKIACNTEVYDTAGNYDNSSNYRFTPTTAGEYYVYGTVYITSPTDRLQYVDAYIYKNGSAALDSGVSTYNSNYLNSAGCFVGGNVTFNGSSDYIELYGVAGGASTVSVSANISNFGAYKIIGA